MSEHAFLKEQKIGTQFSGVYYVSAVSIKKTKTNSEYTEFTLKDKSGSVFAKLWSVDPNITKGMYVSAVISVDEYQNAASYILRSIKPYEKTVEIENYISTVENKAELIERFNNYCKIAEDASNEFHLPLYSILKNVFSDEFKDKFFKAPSSLGNYYGKEGGALENTINVCSSAIKMSDSYKFTEKEKAMLITSALLSRIGSVECFTFNNCAAEKTLNGELVGIQGISNILLFEAWKKVENKSAEDKQSFLKLLHAVTSTEGTESLPCTKEAILLKNVMFVDAKMVDMFEYIDRDEHIEDGFTTFDSNSKRRYYVGE